ncbi:M28 family metallopeptidase [Ichthyenterobacterium magnum]|uniref:Peptidase M28-like protein n=1 Tax=Ichthyenterobacterium magnum TaxID=1230530 RepID=A0A420DL37_9FLAO|nr:M28 family metallopeptidase [Ichthyenterobacterium magnum]RKE94908.1 peptidase M28-like protein [Ichthyenterobacterium magnum]
MTKMLIYASVISLVGSCAHKRHTEKIQDIKDSIVFEDVNQVLKYSKSITSEELSNHLYTFSSDEFQGRKTGEVGHNKASKFIKDYYINQQIPSPLGVEKYYQHIPKSFFSNDIKSSQNIISFIEGSTYPDEVIIISAHSDHEGYSDTEVYNGADDNASGTVAILEIAQAFKLAKEQGHGPKRSIVFIHFTGEELNLTGSRYYVKHPIFPLTKTIANLNIDMIGRVDNAHLDNPNYIYLIGSDRLSTKLHYISEKANREFTNLELDYKLNSENDVNSYYSRSDHYNFASKGVPVIFYFNGEHDDYHKPTDTPEKINFPLLEKRTKLIFSTAWYLVNSDEPIIADKLQ